MNTGFIIGFSASIITAAVVYFIIMKVTGSKGLKGTTFDERQEQARGKAYKYGFYTMLIGILALMIIEELEISMPLSTGLLLFIIAMTGVVVYAVYSIMHDAYFGLNTKWRTYLIVLILVVACNVAGGAYNLIDFSKTGGEVLDLTHGANICVAIGFVPLLIAIATKKLSERSDDDEES